jgi:hypothetical protein
VNGGEHRRCARTTLRPDLQYPIAVAFEIGENGEAEPQEQRTLSEEEFVEKIKQTFDACEVSPE